MTIPFSRSFPKICLFIKQFMSSFLLFSEGFSQQNSEMDDLLKKSLDNILAQTTSGTMSRIVAKGNIGQAMQIITNVSYFEKATAMFEEILMERR